MGFYDVGATSDPQVMLRVNVLWGGEGVGKVQANLSVMMRVGVM